MDAWGDLKSKAFLGDEDGYRLRLMEQVGELPSLQSEVSDSDDESTCSSLEIFFSAITHQNQSDAEGASIGTSTECGSSAGQMDASTLLDEGLLDETNKLMEHKTDQNDPRTINIPNKVEARQNSNSGHSEDESTAKRKLKTNERPNATLIQPPDTKVVGKYPLTQKSQREIQESVCTATNCKESSPAENTQQAGLTKGTPLKQSSPERIASTTGDFGAQPSGEGFTVGTRVTKGSLDDGQPCDFRGFDKYGFGGLNQKASGSSARGLGVAETAACLNLGEGVAKIFDNLGLDDLLDEL